MLEPYLLLKSTHLMVVGIWLGAEFGTAVAFRRLGDYSLSLAHRTKMYRLVDLLDIGAHTSLISLFSIGFALTYLGDWGFIGVYGPALAWYSALAGGAWIAAVWHQDWVNHPPVGQSRPEAHIRLQRAFSRVDIVLRMALAISLSVAATSSLLWDAGPIAADWLSIKLLMFALIIALGICIRAKLPRIGVEIEVIRDQGTTAGRESLLAESLRPLQRLMVATWTCIFFISWLSVAKL